MSQPAPMFQNEIFMKISRKLTPSNNGSSGRPPPMDRSTKPTSAAAIPPSHQGEFCCAAYVVPVCTLYCAKLVICSGDNAPLDAL